jgi:chaperonin GroEL
MNKVHELIKRSVNKIVDPIKVTLGPKGKTVAYTLSSEFQNIKPLITKDGATVAINIMSNDKYENQIISIVREGSIQTMLSSGDGTTTTAILIQALINKGYELIEEGISFYDLSRAFDKALLDVKKYLKSNSINVETNEELLKDIASISSNDEKIGSFLYDLIKEIGIYGDIDVRTSMLNETSIEKHFGMKLNQG